MRKLLYFAYAKALEDVIRLSSARTHEVQALASSMAFTTHYLRDVSTFAGALHSLGPVVAAQKVIHPPGKN